ncbi:MAG: hypothetical protein Q9186_001559 [Xanthomendoza sp. 1 TL-2023]
MEQATATAQEPPSSTGRPDTTLPIDSMEVHPIAQIFNETIREVLVQSMNTFLVSEALAQNGWQALILPGVDGEGINNEQQGCPQWAVDDCNADPDIGCSSHDEFGQCHEYYWWFSRDAAICQFQNMLLLLKPQLYSYNVSNDQAGFLYSASIPEVVDFERPQSSGVFLPIAGGAFVALSKNAKVTANQFHPISSPFTFDPVAFNINPACASNLNVSIANSWKTDNWVGNNP